MNRFVLALLAAAAIAVPATAEPKDDLDQALTRAKKEKRYVSVVFTQFG